MKSNKGFTLIELLAVIVILAIIMVIAVPQILNTINSSKDKAWKSSVGMIEDAIELNIGLSSTGMAEGDFTSLADACSAADPTNVIKSIADFDDIEITCQSSGSTYTFSLEGTSNGEFSGKTGSLACTVTGGCTATAN